MTSDTKKRKRNRKFSLKHFPMIPVKGLWESATLEQQEKAHRTAAAVMEYWLGYSSKAEISAKLEMPPVRIWQLSQQAASGMVAGLLTQPKVRAKQRQENGVTVSINAEEDPKKLLKKIHALERTVEIQTKLIEILREFPSQRALKLPTQDQKALESFKADAAEGFREFLVPVVR